MAGEMRGNHDQEYKKWSAGDAEWSLALRSCSAYWISLRSLLHAVSKNANDNQSDPQKFWRVARELHEMLAVWRRAAFHVSFESTEFSEKDSEASIKKIEQALLKNNNQRQKRFRTQSLKIKISKKELIKSPAVIWESTVYQKWCIFENLVKKMKLSAYHVQETK